MRKFSKARRIFDTPLLDIVYRSVSSLIVYERNAKLHSKAQIAKLARSFATYGFISPILIDAHGVVIAGHGRLEAARLAGLTEVPTICLGHLTEAQARAYRIADNRLAEVGTEWSFDKLQAEFDDIATLDMDFDLSMTGFEIDEIERLHDLTVSAEDEEEQALPEPPDRLVTRVGDIWLLGEHRLICGDATVRATYRALLEGQKADLVLSDPPFNQKIQGHVSGLGRHRHREFVQASGEMSDQEFQAFLFAFMLECAYFARVGALHYIFMDWRGLMPLQLAASAVFDEQVNLCVWAKTQAGMGSLYRSQHELVAIYKKGKARHDNNVRLGATGRHRSNVWNYAGMNTPSRERDYALAVHPSVKPLAMIRDAILDVTSRGDIVLDAFGGSGTTLVAAGKTGRVARLIELDPIYCDVIVKRSVSALGARPILAETGEEFEAVAARRGREAAHV